MTKKQLKKRLALYENALANIWKLGGRYVAIVQNDRPSAYYDDPVYVAMATIYRNNPQLYQELVGVAKHDLTVSRKGRLKPARFPH